MRRQTARSLTISTLFFGAIWRAIRELTTFINAIKSVPNASPGFILYGAVRELQAAFQALDHRVFIDARAFESYVSTGVGHALSCIRVTEFHALTGSADTSA